MTKENLIATLADLKAQRAYVRIRYDNSPWAMGPAYRDELEQLDKRITATEDAINAL